MIGEISVPIPAPGPSVEPPTSRPLSISPPPPAPEASTCYVAVVIPLWARDVTTEFGQIDILEVMTSVLPEVLAGPSMATRDAFC